MKIRLLKNVSARTSRGMLSKAWYEIDGVACLVKGNSVSESSSVGYEPYSEVMASRIARVLGFDHVEYTLENKSLFPDIEVLGIDHVSVCRDFVPVGSRSVSLDKFLYSKILGEPKDYLEAFRKFLPMDPLYRLLVFDALVGNEDRHERNIDILLGPNGEEMVAPIFDNGASLLAWRSDAELTLAGSVGRLDNAKPFRRTHSKQINIVPSGFLPRTDIPSLLKAILEAISPLQPYLPERKFRAIVSFLSWRIKYVEKVMG